MENREIKFKRLMRYKVDGALSWMYQTVAPSPFYEFGNNISPSFFEKELPDSITFEWVSPPLQFTGIIIKGVDIYESDRGKNNVAEWEVTFNKGCFCGKRIDGEESETHIALRAIQGFEYSGNIYEDKFKK